MGGYGMLLVSVVVETVLWGGGAICNGWCCISRLVIAGWVGVAGYRINWGEREWRQEVEIRRGEESNL